MPVRIPDPNSDLPSIPSPWEHSRSLSPVPKLFLSLFIVNYEGTTTLNSLLDPTILCFIVGMIAGLAKSDLRLPKSTYEFVSLYLLLAIGFKGGVQLSKTNMMEFLPSLFGILFIGCLVPILAYLILRTSKKISQVDAGSIAAHRLISAVTCILLRKQMFYESYVTTLMVVQKSLCVGIFLAKGASGR